MEYIKKSLSKPTDWLLLGVVICLIVLVFYNRTVEHATNTNNDDDESPPTTSELPSIPSVNVQVNELPVSQEALRQAIGEVYRADISAIKNLSDIAKALQKGNGIKIPGKLVVNGETDLVGSVKKLTVDGDTSLKSKLNVDGDTNLKTKLTVDGDTSLKSKLNVTGETTLANLTASQYVATDANKNLVSYQNPASLICYSIVGIENETRVDCCGKWTALPIKGNEGIKRGITLNNGKLTVSLPPNIKVGCQILYTSTSIVDDSSSIYLKLYLNGNPTDQYTIVNKAGAIAGGTQIKVNPTAFSIIELKNGDIIEFYGNTESNNYGRWVAFGALSISIIGLFY